MTTLPVEKLVSKDTSMVHEIRVSVTLIGIYDVQISLELYAVFFILNVVNTSANFLIKAAMSVLT